MPVLLFVIGHDLRNLCIVDGSISDTGAGPDVTVEQLREILAAGDIWLFEVVDRQA